MTNMARRQFNSERNLHKLFATHLPVVPLPADFAEQLVQSVLDEVAQHTQNKPMSAEHRLLPAAKSGLRRPLRVKRPPQVLVAALLCLCVSVLFMVSS